MTPDQWPPLSDESMSVLADAFRPRRVLMFTRRHRQDLERMIPREWVREAVCASADPEAWQVDGSGRHASSAVLRICGACPTRAACLAAALVHGEDEGVWAGTSVIRRVTARQDIAAGIPAETVVKELLMEVDPPEKELPVVKKQQPPKSRYDGCGHGCMCEPCKETRTAARERMRAHRAKQKELAA